MNIQQIIMLAVGAFVAIAAIVSLIIALVKFITKYKAAQTTAEKEAAINDLKSDVNSIVQNVEDAFEKYKKLSTGDTAVLTTGKPFSDAKKMSAMTKLKLMADEKGYDFDPAYWSEYIEQIVSVMNTHKNAEEDTEQTTTMSAADTTIAAQTTVK